jgi:hypothetical protein
MYCIFLFPACRRFNSSRGDQSKEKLVNARVTLRHFNGVSEWVVVNLALSVTGKFIWVWPQSCFPTGVHWCAVRQLGGDRAHYLLCKDVQIQLNVNVKTLQKMKLLLQLWRKL